jgi:hypothetical protein
LAQKFGLLLDTWPFGNLPSDFSPLVEFIEAGRRRPENFGTASQLSHFAGHPRALMQRIGLLACRCWAQHIVD